MEKADILKNLQDVFIDVLDNKDIVLVNETTAKDVDEWDSLTHFELVVAIEGRFNVTFNAIEIHNWKNIGDLIENIQKKLPE